MDSAKLSGNPLPASSPSDLIPDLPTPTCTDALFGKPVEKMQEDSAPTLTVKQVANGANKSQAEGPTDPNEGTISSKGKGKSCQRKKVPTPPKKKKTK